MSYMKEDRFIAENAETWRKLEALSEKIKSGGLRKIDSSELDTFYFLYNRACGHLSQARTSYGNSEVVNYLNRLVEDCHSLIYTTKSSNFRKFLRFFLHDFQLHTWENRYFLLVSFLIFAAASLFSYILTAAYTDNASAFLPKQMLEGMNFDNRSQMWNSPIMSSFILTNNIKVGFIAFALGVTLGAGTVWVLASNAFLIGALGAFAQQSGHGFLFWSLILPHGVPELFAIFMCGAAGLIIGCSLISPGQYSRKDSFIMGGKSAIKLIGGTIPIFVIAGLIEGFFTPLPIQPAWKYLFAIIMAILLSLYFIIPIRKGIRTNTTISGNSSL